MPGKRWVIYGRAGRHVVSAEGKAAPKGATFIALTLNEESARRLALVFDEDARFNTRTYRIDREKIPHPKRDHPERKPGKPTPEAVTEPGVEP